MKSQGLSGFTRKRRLAAATFLAVFLGFSLPGLAAFRLEGGENVVIPQGETVVGDLYSSAGTTVVEGTITGDLVAFGRTVIMNGRVEGSILSFAQNLTVNGPVGGNIRAGGQNLTLNAKVGKNITIMGASAFLSPSSAVDGGVIGWLGRIEARGRIADDLLLGVGEAVLGGEVGGRVDAASERITVLPETRVDGEFRYYSPRRAEIPESARLSGGVEFEPVRRREMTNWRRVGQMLQAGWFFGLLLLIVLLWLLYPGKLGRVTVPEKATWTRGFLLGLGGLVVGPVVIALVFATLLGIPVALVLLGLYLLGFLLALPLAGSLVGRQLNTAYLAGRNLPPALIAAGGTILLVLLGLVPLIGCLVTLLATVLGFGLYLEALRPPAGPTEKPLPGPGEAV
jgi:cytoskeletal protein CcmA (bactofilin family)